MFTQKFRNFTDTKWFLILGIALSFVLHSFFFNNPPRYMHTWRQTITLSVARNFYEEEMNILKPRVDNRYDTKGITGCQFPSYEFLLANIYKVTGENYFVQRVYAYAWHLLGVAGMYFLALLLTKNRKIANYSLWIYLWSPMLFYYGISALPDNTALPMSIWGLYFCLRWIHKLANIEDENTNVFYLGGMALLTSALAGMTKMQYLAFGFFVIAYVFHYRNKINITKWLALSIFGGVVAILTLGWYKYANYLIEQSGFSDFVVSVAFDKDIVKGLKTLSSNLISSLPENILNFASFTLFVIGVYWAFKNKIHKTVLGISMLVWVIVFIAYHIIELSKMGDHDYYMMPYMPILVLVAAYGAYKVDVEFSKKWILVLLILIQPLLVFVRIVIPGFLDKNPRIPIELYEAESRDKLQKAVPNSALCIVGPDVSKCINYYFIHKKGFGFGSNDELFEKNKQGEVNLENYINRGAKYIYTNSSELLSNDLIKSHLDSLVIKEGEFYVYKLK